MLFIDGFIWEDWVVDKLDWKHHVSTDEAEEAFFNLPYKVRRTEADKYLLYGRTQQGRYLFIVFVRVERQIKVISARDMEKSERQYFGRK